jgi:phospholipase C
VESKPLATLDAITTIVVVMMENRSFDHVLGYLCLPQYGGRTDLDGLVNPDTDPRFANDYEHQIYRPFAIPDGPLSHDLPHARREVETQLAFSGGTATMTGFVRAYIMSTHSVVEQPPPLGYLTANSVFMSNFFARNYLICDHWFAPLPADTHPNRAMAYTGVSLIDDTKARLIPYRNLVFDWLTAHGVRWRVYHSGFSFFSLFGIFEQTLGDNFRSVRQLADDFANDPDDVVPQVIFVEPEYVDSPVHFGFIPNDNHPPLPIGPGEHFLRDVYAALTNSRRWAGTMLIVTHDEHGGFFDHVPPRPIRSHVPPGALYRDPFATTGVRVPAIIASPLVQSGTCYSGTLDHTSILQLFAEKFGGGRRGYSDDVNRRLDQGIESVSSVLSSERRQDVPVPPTTPVPALLMLRATTPIITENQKAFEVAAQQLLAYDRIRAIRQFPELIHLLP